MATVTLDVTATPGDGVQSYWIAVHDQDVPMNNDQGSVDLESPGSYILVWHFIGDAGDTIGITGEVAGDSVVEVKKSVIPNGEIAGAGQARFTV